MNGVVEHNQWNSSEIILIWFIKESHTGLNHMWVSKWKHFYLWPNYSFKSACKRCTKEWFFCSFRLICQVHDGNGVKMSVNKCMNEHRQNKSTAFQECKRKQFQERKLLLYFANSVLEGKALLCRRRVVPFASITHSSLW